MKHFFKMSIIALLLLLGGISAYPAELAILRNGFAIRHERRQPRNTEIRLYLTATSNDYIDVPAGEIVGYERIDPQPAQVPSSVPASNIDEVISAASIRNGIDRDLVISLIRAESDFNTKALSPKGAQGLMQLMPQTAGQLGVKDPMDPASNVEGGTRYLRELLDLFNNDLVRALAAYNAGPQRVVQYRGVPPYPETRTYVSRILSDFNRKKLARKDQNRKRDLL